MFNDLFKLFELLSRSNAAITFTALGFFLLVAGMAGLSRIITLKPAETSQWLIRLTATCFGLGVLFAAIGPAAALLNIKASPIDKLSSREAWSRLKTNQEVKWLIRLIAYDPKQRKDLSIGQLKTLGPKEVDYTFVAAYDELKGYTVKDALEMVGAATPPTVNYRVSAIIFPMSKSIDIFPANGRGLLQVIQDLEAKHPEFTNKMITTDNLAQEKINDLRANRSIGTWSFSYVQSDYTKFCQMTHKARCSKRINSDGSKSSGVDGLNRVSEINMDWHPAGGVIINQQKIDPCVTNDKYCDIQNWDDIEADIEKPVGNRFGARGFLVKNLELESLENRYLIDFGNPSQLIPEIGDN